MGAGGRWWAGEIEALLVRILMIGALVMSMCVAALVHQ